jgi:hypothetical protein
MLLNNSFGAINSSFVNVTPFSIFSRSADQSQRSYFASRSFQSEPASNNTPLYCTNCSIRVMVRDGGNERAQCLVNFFCGGEYFCHIGVKYYYQRTVIHAAGKAVGFGFFIIKLVFGGHIRNFTGFACGRFFHSLLFHF